MEHSPIGTALVGLDGAWLWTNAALRNILGYSRDELAGLDFQRITHPDDLDADLDKVAQLIAGEGTAYEMEKRYLRADGSTVWCLLTVSLIHGDDAAPAYFVSNVQDITQRKADEIDRAALTERVTLATAAGGVGVWEWNIVTDRLIWDARMFELYGVPASVAPSYQTFVNAIVCDHRERVDKLLKEAVNGTADYDTEFPILTANGEVRQLRATAALVRDPSGDPARMIGTNWDVTEHRKLVLLAEQAARSKSEFLATISHELRTPLNSIIGFSELVLFPARGEAALPATARRHIELVRDASENLLTIVNDVLDFSRIEAGGYELSPTTFDLHEMVENAIEIARPSAEPKGLLPSLSIADVVPQLVVGDQNRLRQILMNLLANAIKFTATGRIQVALSMTSDNEVMWEVVDNGIGVQRKSSICCSNASARWTSPTEETSGDRAWAWQ